MDFGALPPEIKSARMYAGPGSGSMMAAAASWNGLAAQLQSAAASYGSTITGLTSGRWIGPSSTAMAAAAAPYVAWMSATAGQAELAGTQALAAAGAYEAAFAMTVPPPVIAANRALLMMLVATNFLGQNTPAITATEAQYAEMWAQDAAAMYSYAATSAATAAQVTPFTAAPQTANAAGLAVPPGWGWAAAGPAGMRGSAPMLAPAAVPLVGADLGAGLGFPFMFPERGAPLAAQLLPNTGPPPRGGARQPPDTRRSRYPRQPRNIQCPSDSRQTDTRPPDTRRPSIVYLPTNGHESANV